MGGISIWRPTFVLELDGRLAGRFFGLDGGMAKADVIEEGVGSGLSGHKHLGAVKYEHMLLTCGVGMSRAFYEWVGSAFGGASVRKSGAVIALDHTSKPAARLDFSEALVASLVLPGLDRSSRGGATMAVSISPERTSYQKSDKTLDLGVYAAAPKAWSVGAFRIQIDGLSKECSQVTSISSLTLGMNITTDVIGSDRYRSLVPLAVEFSNIALELPGTSAEGFTKWHQDSVVKGNPSTRNGSVDFLAPGSSTPYFSVSLRNVGIYGMSSPGGPMKATLPVKVNLYCEGMSFSASGAAFK